MLRGDYNAASGKQLSLTFTRCVDPEDTPADERKCQSKAKIDNWLRRKFIVVLENQMRFNKEIVEVNKV